MPSGRVTFSDREWGLQVVVSAADLSVLSLLKPMAHHLGAVLLHFIEVGRMLSCSTLRCLMHGLPASQTGGQSDALADLGSVLGEHTHTLRLSGLCLAATSQAAVQVRCMTALLLLALSCVTLV
jgi:hypothetical protein